MPADRSTISSSGGPPATSRTTTRVAAGIAGASLIAAAIDYMPWIFSSSGVSGPVASSAEFGFRLDLRGLVLQLLRFRGDLGRLVGQRVQILGLLGRIQFDVVAQLLLLATVAGRQSEQAESGGGKVDLVHFDSPSFESTLAAPYHRHRPIPEDWRFARDRLNP